MKVKELIELLKKVNQEKIIVYDSYSEMILMSISNVTEDEEFVKIKE